MRPRKKRRIHYIFILAFAVSSILPLLFFLYILLDRGLMSYSRAGIFLLFGLFLAMLGFFFLKSSIKMFTKLSQSLDVSLEDEHIPRVDPELMGRVEEVDKILEAFNSLADQMDTLKKTKGRISQVEKLRAKVDRLSKQLIFLEMVSRALEAGPEPREAVFGSLGKMLEAVRGSWAVVLSAPVEGGPKESFVAGSTDVVRDLEPFLRKVTARVAQGRGPYLKGNMGDPQKGERRLHGPFVSLPVTFGKEVAAALHLGRAKDSQPFTPDEIRFMRVAGNLLAPRLGDVFRPPEKAKPPRIVEAPEPPPEPEVEIEPPVKPAVEMAPPLEAEEHKPPEPNTVMVVDDEPSVRSVLAEFLKGKGLRVMEAGDGSEALAKLRSERPQVVLLDINMPNMDGMEFLRIIHKEYRDVAVVMITSETEDRVFKEAIALGAYDYVVKPIDFGYLENVLRYKLLDI